MLNLLKLPFEIDVQVGGNDNRLIQSAEPSPRNIDLFDKSEAGATPEICVNVDSSTAFSVFELDQYFVNERSFADFRSENYEIAILSDDVALIETVLPLVNLEHVYEGDYAEFIGINFNMIDLLYYF